MTDDSTPGNRIDVVLVAGGVWHDIDFARLELLTLLAEHEEFRVRCQADFEDTAWLEPDATHRARILVSYTCDVRPSARAQRDIRDWIERGGRMVALHGTNAALEQTPEGWTAPRDLPLWFDTLGSQFLAHPPIAPYLVENVAPDHWLVAGVEPFEATDELYLNEYPDRGALVPLLQTTYQGGARGFAEREWSEADPVHLVMYVRPLGEGAVLYNTLGHCRGHYDMVPLNEYYPTVDRCSWELPVFYELLRRSIRWARSATSPPTDQTSTRNRMELTRDQHLAMHRSMVRIRLFEEAAGSLMEQGKMPGFLHLYVGQEAVAVGVCEALRENDFLTSTHRGHGHLVAKGGDLSRMMAELMGKATGYCGGKGGSMHINDLSLGMLGANGVVGAGVPIAVGAGFRNKYVGSDQVSVAFFGDAATNIGAFHEAANMACALHLPVVFVCEHNMYGEYTPTERTMLISNIVDRAAGYGMPGVIVDGMDVIAVHEATTEAVDRARRSEGPTLIEAKTYRFYNHHGIQNLGLKYRPDAEVVAWKERDPIFSFEARIVESGIAGREVLDAAWDEVGAAINEAIAFADESPFPDEDQLLAGVFTETSA